MTPPTNTGLLDALTRLAFAALMAGVLFIAFSIASSLLASLDRERSVQMFAASQADARLGGVPAQQRAAAFGADAQVQRESLPEGVLRIPALGIEVAVFPGTDAATLRRGAGRVEWTPPLASDGNVGIAAHRDGAFAPLRHVAVGDTVLVDRQGGTLRYRVIDFYVVNPEDVHVLEPTQTPQVTLITCYPFDFVGAAPRRFIVHAQLVTAVPNTARVSAPFNS